MRDVKSVEINIHVIHSKDGGEISYDRETTIQRIAAFVDDVVRTKIPADHLCSLVIGIKKE